MPLGEITGELLGGVARVIGHLVFELFFEVLVKGTGYAVIRFVRLKSNPSEAACAIVGLGVFAGLLVVGLLVYAYAPR